MGTQNGDRRSYAPVKARLTDLFTLELSLELGKTHSILKG